jgi:hypothetical protein
MLKATRLLKATRDPPSAIGAGKSEILPDDRLARIVAALDD